MGDCDNTVKRAAIRWWTRSSTKGGSLSSNDQQARSRSERRLFSWGHARSNAKNTLHSTGQTQAQPSTGASGDLNTNSSEDLGADTMSRLLRGVVVQRIEDERAALATATNAVDSSPDPSADASSSEFLAQNDEGEIPTWKRVLDLTLIAITYPIWLPVMLLVMAAIKISSPGPIFYRQERVGLGGRSFMIFKFRSMKVHAQTSSHESYFQRLMRNGAPMTKLDADDPRIIPWGRFLRATGLDELPQIFNVLRGEMSLVGPRPSTRLEFERYDDRAQERVTTLPGLTGYWQVNGKNKTTFQQMIEMDLYYAKNASLSLDVWIMMKTPGALLGQTFELVPHRTVGLTKLSPETQPVPARSSDGGSI